MNSDSELAHQVNVTKQTWLPHLAIVIPADGGGSASVVTDAYQLGQLAYQTNGAGTLLASYTYDASGVPESVQVGSDPATALRYDYVYDARGDVVNLTDGSGAVVASYAYDPWGALTSATESIPNANGWVNPYRYDGRDGGGRRCCRGRLPRRAAARRG